MRGMHPEIERRMVEAHLAQLDRLAGPLRRRPATLDGADAGPSRVPRNRPRVRAGLILMRAGARLAKPALPAPWRPEVLPGR